VRAGREVGGTVFVLGAAMLWGISATAAQYLQSHGVSTILIVQMRVTLSCLLLLAACLLFRRDLFRVRLRDLGRLALLGIIGIAGANFTYYATMKQSTVATGILLQYIAPLAVVGYTVLAGEESLTARKVVAALLSLAGCFFAVGGAGAAGILITPGALATGLISMFCFAFLTVFSRHLLARLSTWTVILYALCFASLFWLVVHPPSALLMERHDGTTWGALVLLALASVLFPYLLYFTGLRRIPASRAIITGTAEPVVAIVSAAVLLGEALDAGRIFGALIVLAAIIILQTGEAREGAAEGRGESFREQEDHGA
jgi:drug/metabolite transporter (DMT)-like permease